MARLNMCDRCPRRDTARLFRALGETAAAEEIEREGCVWWWAVSEVNDSGAARIRETCGAEEALPKFLTEFGARIVEAAQTCGSMRNEVATGLSRIAAAAEVTATAAVLRPVASGGFALDPFPGGLTLDQVPRPAGELAAALVDAARAPVPQLLAPEDAGAQPLDEGTP